MSMLPFVPVISDEIYETKRLLLSSSFRQILETRDLWFFICKLLRAWNVNRILKTSHLMRYACRNVPCAHAIFPDVDHHAQVFFPVSWVVDRQDRWPSILKKPMEHIYRLVVYRPRDDWGLDMRSLTSLRVLSVRWALTSFDFSILPTSLLELEVEAEHGRLTIRKDTLPPRLRAAFLRPIEYIEPGALPSRLEKACLELESGFLCVEGIIPKSTRIINIKVDRDLNLMSPNFIPFGVTWLKIRLGFGQCVLPNFIPESVTELNIVGNILLAEDLMPKSVRWLVYKGSERLIGAELHEGLEEIELVHYDGIDSQRIIFPHSCKIKLPKESSHLPLRCRALARPTTPAIAHKNKFIEIK
jgi:hypothetical protein